MKHLLRLLVLVLLCSCSKEVIDTADAPEADRTPSYKISIDSLKRQAVGLGATFGDAATKGRTVRAGEAIRLNSILSTKGITRGIVDNPADPTAYVVNFEDEAGFAILVDDRRLDNNVLAYSESGSVTSATDNPGLLLFMEDANSYMGLLADNLRYVDYVVEEMPDYPYNTHKPRRDGDPYDWGTDQGVKFVWRCPNPTTPIRYYPLLKVNWGQLYPYNQACPIINGRYTPAGCVATAAVMIMSHYQWPQTTTDNGQRYTINWDKAISGDIIGANIHHLMHEVGVDLEMKYTLEGSRADFIDVPPMLRRKGYTSSELSDSSAYKIIDEITAGRPVYAYGVNLQNKGHAWVIDGYVSKFHNIQVTDYLSWDNSTRKVTQIGQRVSANNSIPIIAQDHYWHCNWGWSGQNNGYFIDFKTNVGNFDSNNNPNEHYFHSYGGMIYNIKH